MKTVIAIITILFVAYTLYSAPPDTVEVRYVQDGDTIAIRDGDDTEYVRLEGVDAPEIDECYGRQATAHLRYLVDDTIELYPSDENRGHYGRLIRYVHAGDKDVGTQLIRSGHAQASGFDHPRYDEYKQLEKQARNNNRGLWDECYEDMWDWSA